MAPRRRRSKVGLTRMHAALDAMRPMGFSTNDIRKCVKNLLKVYGDDGWAFIEEAAYKLLIDTILEEAVVEQLEHEPENLLLEGGSQGTYEQSESAHELCDKKVVLEKTHCEDIKIKQEKSQEQDLDIKARPILLQDVNTRPEVGVQLGFALSYSPQPSDSNPKNRACKPCYGWISDDEDDEFLQLTPAKSVDNESLSSLAA